MSVRFWVKRERVFFALAMFLSIFFAVALVEVFFQVNARFHWVRQRFVSYRFHQTSVSSLPMADLVQPVRAIASEYAQKAHLEIRDQFDEIRLENLGQQAVIRESSGTRERAYLSPSDRLLFDVNYELDSHGRRVTPEENKGADKFLLLLGCSHVFGFGLNADQTLPAYLQKEFPQSEVYNMARLGLGPNDYLVDFDSEREKIVLSGVRQRQGTVVYLMKYFHFDRAIFDKYNSQKVLYQLSANGDLQSMGPFFLQRSAKYLLYRLLSMSETLRFIDFDFVLRSDTEKRNYIAILARLKSELAQRFGANNFLLVNLVVHDNREWLQAPLEALGWRVLSISESEVGLLSEYKDKIPYDGHPSPQRNWILSRLIRNEIQRLGW